MQQNLNISTVIFETVYINYISETAKLRDENHR